MTDIKYTEEYATTQLLQAGVDENLSPLSRDEMSIVGEVLVGPAFDLMAKRIVEAVIRNTDSDHTWAVFNNRYHVCLLRTLSSALPTLPSARRTLACAVPSLS